MDIIHLHNFEIFAKNLQYERFSNEEKKLWSGVLSAFHREHKGVYKNLAAASDIARLMILCQKGGEYFDVDVKFKKERSITEQPKSHKHYAVTGFLLRQLPYEELPNSRLLVLQNNWMASKPKSMMTVRALSKIALKYNQNPMNKYLSMTKRTVDRTQGTMALTGPELLSNIRLYDHFSIVSTEHSSSTEFVLDADVKPNDPKSTQWRRKQTKVEKYDYFLT